MRVFLQLLKEFWLPFCAAVVWTIINIRSHQTADWSVTKCVNIFGPSFFLASWLTSQYFRVRKQTHVEDNLERIQNGVKSLLVELETKTKDLLAQLTGGESFCYLLLTNMLPNENAGMAIVIHHGTHPLYDVAARIVDLEAFDKIKGQLTYENIFGTEIRRNYGNLIPGHCVNSEMWNLGNNGDIRRYNVFFTARNGSFTQLLRFKRVNGRWLHATRVDRGGIVFEQVQDNFPKNDKGEVDW